MPATTNTKKNKPDIVTKKITKKSKSKRKKDVESNAAKTIEESVSFPDPWRTLKSPYGGRLSKAEEFARTKNDTMLLKSQVPKELVLQNQKLSSKGKVKLGQVELEGILSCILQGSGEEGHTRENGLYLSFMNCGIGSVDANENDRAWACLVGLNLSQNPLEQDKVKFGGRNCYLRVLQIENCGLKGLSGIQTMDKVLYLNVSGNPLESVGLGNLLVKFPQLRALLARDCQLDSSILERLKALTELEELDFSNNRIGDTRAVEQGLESVKRKLKRLSLSGNPFSELERNKLLDWLQANCSCLQSLDGQDFAQHFSTNNIKIESVLGFADTGESVVQDSSSCSCLEGNACLVPYNCKDWTNRLRVAENARRELRYQIEK